MRTLYLTVHIDKEKEREYVFDTKYFDEGNFLVIGKRKNCHIFIDHTTVSPVHATIFSKDDNYYVTDQGSIDGTILKGLMLQANEVYILPDSGLIQFGRVIVQVKIVEVKIIATRPALAPVPKASELKIAKAKVANFTPSGLRLDAINLNKFSRPIFGKTLLNDISLSFLPREFVVIAGVSGGGKSTLMDALNGQRRARGQVLINGIDLYKNFNAFKREIGYVPQDDIVHTELTVEEALDYTAQLRLPFLSVLERSRRIQKVLEQLQLTERKNVQIGRLSGGQRKRVSIGVELITNPRLFFLDEATSGLDPGTELQIMELLRSLANSGATVVLITHATKNVAIADLVFFLAKGGRLAYNGPPKLAFSYFQVQDFDSIYSRLERHLSPQQWEEHFKSSAYYKKFVIERQTTIPQNDTSPSPTKLKFGQQVKVLYRRNLTILLKNKISLALMLLGVPILGSFNFVLWKPDLFSTESGNAGQAISMLFVIVIMVVMSGSLSTMLEIAKEKSVYKRERSAGLGLAPYLVSKLLLSVVQALYQSAVLFCCLLISVEVPVANIIKIVMYFSLFLASFGSMVMGLFVSVIAPNQSVAPLLIVILLVPQIMFGGGILPPGDFTSTTKVINQYMLVKYPFESLVSLTRIGTDVANDRCWAKGETGRNKLSKKELAKCRCYTAQLFKMCNFPGIGKIKRTTSLNADLLKAHLLIAGILDSYQKIFYVDVLKSSLSMLWLITCMIMILFLAQFIKEYV